MKITGYIFAVIGGLALIGGLAAGHSVIGPLFWLALGIILIYFGKQKEGKQTPAQKNDVIDQHPTQVENPMSPSENETQEIVMDKPMTYWEKYQNQNASVAKAISSQVNLDFAGMTDNDVKETIASVERMASKLNCNVSVIKEQYLKEISKYPVELLPEMIASTSRVMESEAKMYGISQSNTMTAVMVRWLKERCDDLGNPNAEASKVTNNSEIKIVKDLCPYITEETDLIERLKSLRKMSLLWRCPIDDLKETYIADIKQNYDGAYEHFHYLPETLKYLAEKSLETADAAGVKPDNTEYSIMFEWLNEYIEKERARLVEAGEVVCPRCGGRNVKLGFFKDDFECDSCGTRFGGL